jgi:hypothetical protein
MSIKKHNKKDKKHIKYDHQILIKYIVHTGNFRVSINIPSNEIKNSGDPFMEAATQAFEFIFGNRENSDDRFDVISLENEEGFNVLTLPPDIFEELTETDHFPHPGPAIITEVYREKDTKAFGKHRLVSTSAVFTNAALPEHAKAIEEAIKESKSNQ